MIIFKKGENVKVKSGIKIPDLEEFDMAGWQGRIVGFVESEEVKGEYLLEVEWDSLTIKGMSEAYIKKNIENEYDFESIVLDKSEVEKTTERDKSYDRTPIVAAIKQRLKYSGKLNTLIPCEIDDDDDDDDFNFEDDFDGIDEDDDMYKEILGENIRLTNKNVKKYYNFIIANITLPCMLTGIESMGRDFGWEEKFGFGYGSEKERLAMRQNRPSYSDTFEFLEFLPKKIEEYETIPVRVCRVDDKKIFILRLDELKAIDEESENYELFDNFSVWVVNY